MREYTLRVVSCNPPGFARYTVELIHRAGTHAKVLYSVHDNSFILAMTSVAKFILTDLSR